MSCGLGPAKITVRLDFSLMALQPALLDYRELIFNLPRNRIWLAARPRGAPVNYILLKRTIERYGIFAPLAAISVTPTALAERTNRE